jgi:hypothetical protein
MNHRRQAAIRRTLPILARITASVVGLLVGGVFLSLATIAVVARLVRGSEGVRVCHRHCLWPTKCLGWGNIGGCGRSCRSRQGPSGDKFIPKSTAGGTGRSLERMCLATLPVAPASGRADEVVGGCLCQCSRSYSCRSGHWFPLEGQARV